jgi:tetratricopeptide (TPR) repeat protein
VSKLRLRCPERRHYEQSVSFSCGGTNSRLVYFAETKAIFGSSDNPELELTRAVLAGDWTAVYRQSAGPASALGPVRRAIKGHACLALNLNDESLALFLSMRNETDRHAWHVWAVKLAGENESSAVAQYLKGDACARIRDWPAALGAYREALGVDPGFALALNARGVAYAELAAASSDEDEKNSLVDKALEDFEEACRKDPSLADAWANHGTLMLMQRVPNKAFESFQKALALSRDGFCLALNGRGCARYGQVRPGLEQAWQEANKDFAAAGRRMPLPIILWNLRALGVAAENTAAPELVDSPLFRPTDFLDWDALREDSQNAGGIIRTFVGHALPEEPTPEVLRELNIALENPEFYEQIRGKLRVEEQSERLANLLHETRKLRAKRQEKPTGQEKAKLRLLNRLVIEAAYPFLIARHDQRNPGMQLTLRQGLMDSMTYRSGLSTQQILAAQKRMDYIYRPAADAVSRLPVVGALGAQWNRHLDVATRNNAATLAGRGVLAPGGVGASKMTVPTPPELRLRPYHTSSSPPAYRTSSFPPGDVAADLRKAYVERGEWPVINWFGLAQTIALPSAGANANENRQQ